MKINVVSDLGAPPERAFYDPKVSQYHAVVWKIWQNCMLAHPGGLAPPSMENPGSAPEAVSNMS